jgi:hypothetical protein
MKLEPSLISRAFSVDPDTVEAARDEIIETNDVEAFYECITKAREANDIVNLEFWLVEVATSRKSVETIAGSLIELTKEVLIPQSRNNEAMVYLKYIQSSVFSDLHKEVSQLIVQLESQISNDQTVAYSDNWRNYDLSKRLEIGHDQQHYYDRFIAYFHETNDEKMSERIEEFKVDYLPRIMGYFIGLSESLEKFGVKRDTAVKAYMDFLKLDYPDFRPGLLKVGDKKETTSSPPQSPTKVEKVTTKKSGYGISKS